MRHRAILHVLTSGVHAEWNVRDLRLQSLEDGGLRVSFVCKDDDPASADRRRHPDVPISLVLPKDVDWHQLKSAIFCLLESIKEIDFLKM
jgi:hypothetical protein